MLGVVVAGLSCFVILAWLDPAQMRELAAKEGSLEVAGEALLVAAVVGWLLAAWEARGDARRLERWVCLGLVLTCALVLGEELDWGGALKAVIGRPNLHNAWGGASYVLFMLPVALLVGVVGWRRGDEAGRLPGRRDAVALALLGVASIGGSLAWPEWERQIDEVVETLLYAGLAWISLWPVGPASGLSSSA
jgi:hypothetical protein